MFAQDVREDKSPYDMVISCDDSGVGGGRDSAAISCAGDTSVTIASSRLIMIGFIISYDGLFPAS
jgi:hypothetical protein